jgi:hypothetical protein
MLAREEGVEEEVEGVGGAGAAEGVAVGSVDTSGATEGVSAILSAGRRELRDNERRNRFSPSFSSLSPAKMAKRRDATATKPTPAPSTARPASKPAPPPRKKPSPLRTLYLIIRIALCLVALRIIWIKIHKQDEPDVALEEPDRVTYEPIELDEERRTAVHEAFKVRSPLPCPC